MLERLSVSALALILAIVLSGGILLATMIDYDRCINTSDRFLGTEDIPIVSLSDGSRMIGYSSGGFFIGTGFLSQVPTYFFYVQNSDGSYSLATAPAGASKLFLDADDHPYVKKYNYLGHPACQFSYYYNKFEFHVPKNTIVTNFVADGVV